MQLYETIAKMINSSITVSSISCFIWTESGDKIPSRHNQIQAHSSSYVSTSKSISINFIKSCISKTMFVTILVYWTVTCFPFLAEVIQFVPAKHRWIRNICKFCLSHLNFQLLFPVGFKSKVYFVKIKVVCNK